jgi:hypothetical protein
MPSALPLFAFGLGIIVLVVLGVVLALSEFRAAHTSPDAVTKDQRAY